MSKVISQVEIENTCTCFYCPKCEYSNFYTPPSGSCDECDGELVYGDCVGCYELAEDMFWQVISLEWNTPRPGKEYVRIVGRDMGWTHASGWTVVPVGDMLEAFKINGQWRLVVTLDDEGLRVVRYSHDEPTGASFTCTLVDEPEGEE